MPEGLKLLLQFFDLTKRRLNLLFNLANRRIERLGQGSNATGIVTGLPSRHKAGHGLHTPHASGDRRLSANAEQANLARGACVGAAAQLHRVAVERVGFAADLHHAHRVAILVAEKLQDTFIPGHLAVGHPGPAHDGVVDNALIDQLLNVGHLLRRQRRAVEIKRQLLRANVGTFL